MRPEVLLLDEPCSALDPIATTKIENLLAKLRSEYTVVIVTHNLAQAMRVADYTTFLTSESSSSSVRPTRSSTHPVEKLTENYVTVRSG